jgi:hypothetical protein
MTASCCVFCGFLSFCREDGEPRDGVSGFFRARGGSPLWFSFFLAKGGTAAA